MALPQDGVHNGGGHSDKSSTAPGVLHWLQPEHPRLGTFTAVSSRQLFVAEQLPDSS